MLRTLFTIARRAIALALPAAAAALTRPTRGEAPRGGAPPDLLRGGEPPAVRARPNLLRDGKYALTPAQRVEVVRIVKPSGFDFTDAGIGAAVGAAALAVLGGLLIVLHRDSARVPA